MSGARPEEHFELDALENPPLTEGASGYKERGGLTIFIPSHNCRASLPGLLRDALDAIPRLEERGFSVQILVVDDASRDGSQTFLWTARALYDEPRFEVMCLRRSLGARQLRNLVLQMCRFRYLCTVQAGNRLAPENLPALLESARDTGAALVYGNVIYRLGDEIVGMSSNTPVNPSPERANYVDGFCITDAWKLSRLGGYAGLHPEVPDDWEMLLHLEAEEELVLFVPVVMGYRFVRSPSASEESELSEDGVAALQQVYASDGTREWEEMRIGRIYHPEAGFVDEW